MLNNEVSLAVCLYIVCGCLQAIMTEVIVTMFQIGYSLKKPFLPLPFIVSPMNMHTSPHVGISCPVGTPFPLKTFLVIVGWQEVAIHVLQLVESRDIAEHSSMHWTDPQNKDSFCTKCQ